MEHAGLALPCMHARTHACCARARAARITSPVSSRVSSTDGSSAASPAGESVDLVCTGVRTRACHLSLRTDGSATG